VPDAIFEDPRLAEIYDPLDPDRCDLDAYAAIAAEFGAESVVDVGCGAGTLACLLARRGLQVTAIDPAAGSLQVARREPGADRVRWLQGDATVLPALQADLVTMTGNVAQVFVTGQEWAAALQAAARRCGAGAGWCSKAGIQSRRPGWSGTGTLPTGGSSSQALAPCGRGLTSPGSRETWSPSG
jgi:SAM-dependent methyltransferase